MSRAWLLMGVAACSASPSAPDVRGAPFGLVLCERAQAGSPGCPYTHYDLGLDDAPGSEAAMYVLEGSQALEAWDIAITAGAGGLYAENPRFDDCWPGRTPVPAMWPTINLREGERASLSNVFLIEPPICFAADVIDAYQP